MEQNKNIDWKYPFVTKFGDRTPQERGCLIVGWAVGIFVSLLSAVIVYIAIAM